MKHSEVLKKHVVEKMDYRIRDTVIIGVSVLAIFTCLYFTLGTINPFYIVSSGSMVPVLNIYDAIIINANVSWDDIAIGDMIVFHRPIDDVVIVHRVIAFTDLSVGKTAMTKGDANPESSKGTDFPITEDLYIGKVIYVIPSLGHLVLLLQPPYNYIAIIVIFALIALKLKY